MKELKIRTIKSPAKLPANLPAGCLADGAELDRSLCDRVAQLTKDGNISGAVATWFDSVEDQLVH
eukprot:622444-Karenia_brevis.AAC.1